MHFDRGSVKTSHSGDRNCAFFEVILKYNNTTNESTCITLSIAIVFIITQWGKWVCKKLMINNKMFSKTIKGYYSR